MSVSQNAVFKCSDFRINDSGYPPGEQLATYLFNILKKDRQVHNFENWRDCGWFFECSKNNIKLELIISYMDSNQWFLQIAPSYIPGIFGRIKRKQPSASYSDILELSKDIHNVLSSDQRFSDLRWKWDGRPDEKSPLDPLDIKNNATMHG